MVCAEGTTRGNPHDPCPWEGVDPGACDSCWDDIAPAVQERSIQMATALLWRLSGRQFGECCITIRPCGPDCFQKGSTYAGWSGVGLNGGTGGGNDILRPAIINGQWVNCGCMSDCCGPDCVLTLPVTPATSVNEIVIDGRTLFPEEYQILDRRHLNRAMEPALFPADRGLNFVISFPSVPVTDPNICLGFEPDTVTGSTQQTNGCYLPTVSNPSFTTALPTYSFKVERGSFANVSFVVGETDGTNQYQFPTTGSANADEVLTSTRRSDGSWAVISVSGEGSVQRVGNPLVVTGEPTITVEFFSLVRGGCWPECNDWDKDLTEPGTWAVSYSWGTPVPADGLYAASVLAVEFAKACTGDKSCRLPRRVQSLARQGVSVQFVDDGSYLNEGLLGLLEVDQWLRSINPYGLRERSRVYSPETLKRDRFKVWPG